MSVPNRATSAYGQSVFEYDPKSRAAEAFERLVAEIIEQMIANEGPWRPFSIRPSFEVIRASTGNRFA